MADPKAIVPYHDPYDTSYTDDIFNFINNPNLTFADLSLIEQGPPSIPTSSNNNPHQFNDIITDASDPFDDPVFWDINGNYCNIGGISQAGPSENNHAETSNGGGPPEIEDYANMMEFPIWPVPAVPYLCSCCLVLREIIHTNGHDTTKLEIHGRLGLICHGIHEIRQSNSASQHHMIDFCKKSIENVKEYLVQYCEEQKLAGFMMLPDPLSVFYQAVCVGLDWDENNLTTDDYSQSATMANSSGENEEIMNQLETTDNDSERAPLRTSLAAQRERAGKLTVRDLINYFHLPIEEAARRMKLCPTVVKKICRRDGMHRWPHRKIKSIERRMSIMTGRLSSNDAEERTNAEAEIQKLREEMAVICAGLSK